MSGDERGSVQAPTMEYFNLQPLYHFGRADVFKEAFAPEKAVASYEEIQRLGGYDGELEDSAVYHLGCARAWEEVGNLAEAEIAYTKATNRDPNNPFLLSCRLHVHYLLGNLKDAPADIDAIIGLN